MPPLKCAEPHTCIDVTMYGAVYPLSGTRISSREEMCPSPCSGTGESGECSVTHPGGGGDGGGKGGGGEGGGKGGAGLDGGAEGSLMP